MAMMLSKWTVSEYAKQMFMRTGTPPTRSQLQKEFPELSREAVDEGYQEFQHTVYGRKERSEGHESQETQEGHL